MTHAFTEMRTRINRLIAYRNTVAALRALSLHSRLDLDIAGVEKRAAHRAVYGS